MCSYASPYKIKLCAQVHSVMQMLFSILAAVGVFLLVPRGISAGVVEIQSDHMSWNTSKGTYQLRLLAKIPIYNPNYMKVYIIITWPAVDRLLHALSDKLLSPLTSEQQVMEYFSLVWLKIWSCLAIPIRLMT